MEQLAGRLRTLSASISPTRHHTRLLADSREDAGDVGREICVSEPASRPTSQAPSQSISLIKEGKVASVLVGEVTFVLYTKHIRAHERGPYTLGLSCEQGPLPPRLRCTYSNGTLGLYVGPGAGRVALYLDAALPATRMEQILLTGCSPPQSFEIGHRRHQVRRVDARVHTPVSDQNHYDLCFDNHMWAEFAAPPWVSRIVTLETFGEDPTIKYIECICLEHHK